MLTNFYYTTDRVPVLPTVAYHGGVSNKFVEHLGNRVQTANGFYWFTDLQSSVSYANMASFAMRESPTTIQARIRIPKCLTVAGMREHSPDLFNRLAVHAKKEGYDGLFAIVPEYAPCPIQWCVFDERFVEVL